MIQQLKRMFHTVDIPLRKYQNHPDFQKLKTKSLQMLPKASNQ